MYTNHHYTSHDSITTRDNTNHHPLGRPASMPSLYSNHYHYSSINNDGGMNMMSRMSLDSSNSSSGNNNHSNNEDDGSYTNASHSWHQHNNGWNHNNNSNSSPPIPTPPHPTSINNNNISSYSNHLSSSTTTSIRQQQQQHDLLPSIQYESSSNSINKTLITTMNSPSTTNNNMISAYNSPTYFVSPTTTTSPSAYNNTTTTTTTSSTSPSHQHQGYSPYGMTSSNSNMSNQQSSRHSLVARPKLTTTLWEDEGTICYQVDANGICVARRQDNDMINGTKLLNVAGMSRGKRDGILKNEKGRVVVKVGAMHLKGVWITFARAKLLSAQYKIQEILYPLFVDDPSVFLYATALHNPMATSRMNSLNNHGYSNNRQQSNFNSGTNSSPYHWDRHNNENNAAAASSSNYRNNAPSFHGSMMNHAIHSSNDDMFMLPSQVEYNNGNNRPSSLIGYGGNNHHQQSSLSHSNSSYSVYPQQQDNNHSTRPPPRMYFTDELLDEEPARNSNEFKSDPSNTANDNTSTASYYGHNKVLPGTHSLASPTSSEAGKSSSSAFHLPPSRASGEYDSTSSITTTASTATSNTTSTAERRQSLVMSGGPRVASPRHHPYMSPGKSFTPSIMSTLQTYNNRSSSEYNKQDEVVTSERNEQLVDGSATAASDINRPW